jgi:RNA polymerase sigma-70 factor (ECF subfamily)
MVPEVASVNAPSLEQLMDSYVKGSDEAFSTLYRRMAPKLTGYLQKLCRDSALVEDALQSTFAKIHRARGSYVQGAPVAPWVLVIARRALFDELRASRARGEVLSDTGVLPDRPFDEGFGRDDARHLERALSQLPGHYRVAIELTKLQGLSGGEAAKALSTTQSAIKLRVHRGYQMLRRSLQAEAA